MKVPYSNNTDCEFTGATIVDPYNAFKSPVGTISNNQITWTVSDDTLSNYKGDPINT